MQAFTTLTAKVTPLDRPNVDTDAIIPKQYLKSIKRTGFGPYLFDDWRYLDEGDLEIDVASRRENPDFVINQQDYRDCGILLARENFGCGSSREHAVWALENYGFRVVIASSFADIFFNNCGNNQMLAIALPAETLEQLFVLSEQHDDIHIEVDLENQQLRSDKFDTIHFDIREDIKERLLSGLDFIGVTETLNSQIDAFESKLKAERPWQ